ncbi:Guanine nucleotide exchange factor for Cdc42p [Lecanicillium sp. MT-2017a]|nr:Guanine nucleotide exchange factor for Cdc42p [Lecanicillium sp. MT-2017a]
MDDSTQFKLRVVCDGPSFVTLLVSFDITYATLIERIDGKLARFTTGRIRDGGLKMQYRNEDGSFILIQDDDDIQTAFLDWRNSPRE